MAASFGIIGLLWFFLFSQKGWCGRNDIVGFNILSFGMVLIIGSLPDTQNLSLITAKMFALLIGTKTGQDEK